MKKSALVLLLLFAAMNLVAGDARVATLGGHTGLVPDDDSNIGLFPQRVNDWNILRIQDIGGDYNDYLLTIGEKGDKWAFYGSVSDEDYLFNVIKGLSPTSAIDVGVQLMTMNAKFTENVNKSELKASNMTLGVDLALGLDAGKSEVAIGAYFARGPYAHYLLLENPFIGEIDYGKIELTLDGQTQFEANASATAFGGGIAIRSPFNFSIFDQLYHGLYFVSMTGIEDQTIQQTKVLDYKDSQFGGAYQLFFFKNKAIAPEGLFNGGMLMYALGFNVGYGTIGNENQLSSVTDKQTYNDMWIGGPSLRIGLETAFKYAKVRFGIQRDITIFESEKAKSEVGDAEQEVSASAIGNGGSLYINSGLGFEIKNLKIDIMLNNNIWSNGPQMILNDTYGDISFQTDVTYTFPIKEK
jgi:hypothetical protein